MRTNGRLLVRLAIVGIVLLLLLLLLVPRLLVLHGSGTLATQITPAPTHGNASLASTPAPTSSAAPNNSPKIFLIVMENNSYSTLIGNASAPWINGAARNDIVATDYYGIAHPSEPNYIALTSGSTQNVDSDADVTLNAPNIVDQLEARGKSWRGYMQGLFSNGNTDKLISITGDYARKHNPFVSYADIQQNPARMANIVDFSQFASDLSNNTVPDFVWITPDLCHDMHGSSSCSDPQSLIQTGDTFLSATVNQIMHSPAWSGNAVIFVTWDESESDDNSGCCAANPGGGHILTLIISRSSSSPRVLNAPYNHYSLLATIENAWGLGCLANTCDTANVQPMNGLP